MNSSNMADSAPADLVSGFSIWAVPDATTEQELGDIIQDYASRLQTPVFLPHMTVLSGVKGLQAAEATEKLTELANALSPLNAEIQTVTFKELYFQCVFGLLHLTSELALAHGRAKEVEMKNDTFFKKVFEIERNETFMPHISVIYGDLGLDARSALAKELRLRLDGRRLKMEKLQLWRTLGPVKTWEIVAESAL